MNENTANTNQETQEIQATQVAPVSQNTQTIHEIKKTYTYEERIDMFKNELELIKSDDVKELAKDILKNAHEYFFYVPASSTGKYHPDYTTGEHGLALHTKALMCFLDYFTQVECCPLSEREKDLLFVAGLVHDTEKLGDDENNYTVYEHPTLAANKIRAYKEQNIIPEEDLEYIAIAVEAHMGQWNTDKYGNEILPKPTLPSQIYVHMADYLASRKAITFNFEGFEGSSNNKVQKAAKYEKAVNMYNEGKDVPEIATELSLENDKVVDLLIDAYKDNKFGDIEKLFNKENEEMILNLANDERWSGYLKDIKNALPTNIPYCEIRAVLTLHNIEKKEKDKSKVGLLSSNKYIDLYLKEKSFRKVADFYKVQVSTVENAVLAASKDRTDINIENFIDPKYENDILSLSEDNWDGYLKSIKGKLPEEVEYLCIKAVLIKHGKM